jgi:hypothetical protein
MIRFDAYDLSSDNAVWRSCTRGMTTPLPLFFSVEAKK